LAAGVPRWAPCLCYLTITPAEWAAAKGPAEKLKAEVDWQIEAGVAQRNAQDAVKALLRDPASAVFDHMASRSACVAEAKDGPCVPAVVTCGTVNSKNGFGGYTGAERFIFLGSRTMFETKSAGFASVWRQACT
jgi:hypothetical protein